MVTNNENIYRQERTKLAVFYHHKNVRHLDRCLIHLAPCTINRNLDVWSDKKIKPGLIWREELIEAVASTRVAVVLVNADFLASESLMKYQLLPLLIAAKGDGASILPVLISPCGFEETGLSIFKFFNTVPVTKMTHHQKEELWSKVAKSSRKRLALGDDPL